MEEARLLAQRSELGYVEHPSRALRAEPEAISEEDQRAISTRARAAFADEREVETRRRDRHMWVERLRKAEQRADARGIDIYKPQVQIREQILMMERLVEEAS